MSDHIADVRHIVGTPLLNRHVPAPTLRFERCHEKTLAGTQGFEPAVSRFARGVSAAAVKIEHQR
jgi:hypothetical protein